VLDFRFASQGYELAEYRDVDFGQVARAIGCEGCRITDPEELGPALERAYASGAPTVIDVVIDHDAVGPVTNFDAIGRQERRVPDEAGEIVSVGPLPELTRS
jgi:thiamine pyrophosphate-dependent acetolactate synthase large subunit-like protein